MTRQELAKYIRDYAPFFREDWRYELTRFVRRKESWIEWVDFRAHYYLRSYLPVHCFLHLKDPILRYSGRVFPPSPAFFVQELQCGKPYPVKCEVEVAKHIICVNEISHLMQEQFYPRINQPLDAEKLYALLKTKPQTSHELFTLCLHAAECGEKSDAYRYLEEFKKTVAGEERRPVIKDRLTDLAEAIELMEEHPELLRSKLRRWEEENLELLGWKE